MSKLIITRSNEWNNRLRQINIYIDDSKLGDIANDETKQFDVLPGTYTLRAKIDWCGSRDVQVEVRDNETKTFILSGFKSAAIIIPFMSMLLVAYLFFKTFLLTIIGCLMFLVIGYYLTVGRKDYLVLKQVS